MGLFGKNNHSGSSTFGKDLPWLLAVRQVFRVKDFDRLNTKMKKGVAIQRNLLKPYGYLIVDSHGLGSTVRLPIIHRDDFGLADSAFESFDISGLSKELELLVTYAPQSVLPDGRSGNPRHVLHYTLAPYGTFQKYYTMNDGIHESKPDLGLIFRLDYHGETSVNILKDGL